MKAQNKIPFVLKKVLTIPDQMQPGVLYYSEQYLGASHLCACGCGVERPVPVKPGQWVIQKEEPLTVTPSFQHRDGCTSHYVISNGVAVIF